ncbi:hypothetical protein UK12_27200 [Saccharothrix sp. ST-888]|nr:hypothetical protein UK12_27200 [Saccharothrix sp. ST-888]
MIGAAVPLFGGASAAWACGDDDTAPAAAVATGTPTATASAGTASTASAAPTASTAPTAQGASTGPAAGSPSAATPHTPAPVHHGEARSAFLPGMPDSITAGGSPIEFGVEMANFTGAAYDNLRPFLGFYNNEAGSHPGGGTNLRPEDFTVQVMTGGQWKTLPVHHGCDPVIYPDTSSLAQHLDNDRAARFAFRVALSAKAPADQSNITVYFGTSDGGMAPARTLHIVRTGKPTGTPTDPAPAHTGKPTRSAPATPPTTGPAQSKAAPTAAISPAAVPMAATPTAAAPDTQQLASTGGGDSSGPLIGAGGALIVLGAAAVAMATRRRSTTRR